MIIPIRCYTCGKILADKYEYYKKEKIRKNLAMNNGEDNDIIDIKSDDIQMKPAGEIMNELGLIRICCRKVMLTSIEIVDEI